MHALATMRWSCVGPWRMNRGLLSCVAAHARTQSSQRVQRSRLISIVCVPLRNRWSARKSSSRGSITGVLCRAACGFAPAAHSKPEATGNAAQRQNRRLNYFQWYPQHIDVSHRPQRMPPHHVSAHFAKCRKLFEAKHLALAEVRDGPVAMTVAAAHAREPGADQIEPGRPVSLGCDERLHSKLLRDFTFPMRAEVDVPVKIAKGFKHRRSRHLFNRIRSARLAKSGVSRRCTRKLFSRYRRST